MKRPKLRTYGHDGTIHGTNYLDVEVNKFGEVVAVWFRCQLIPFKQVDVSDSRANDMKNVAPCQVPKLHAVIVED